MKDFVRWDHDLIVNLVEPETAVLDLGCGGGELLARLTAEKRVFGQAVESDPVRVSEAICNGVAVYQKNLDQGLPEFMSSSFDYVILEKTLQVLRSPMLVLEEMLRIGRLSVISFPNFNYHGVVQQLLQKGRMPVTASLPYQWYDTPNIHLFTLFDFLDWVDANGVEIVASYAASGTGYRPSVMPADSTEAEEMLFVLKREALKR
jgi:methionine biosynthesis protein MetW